MTADRAAWPVAFVLVSAMACLTALVMHHDLPAHVLLSGAVTCLALAAKSPFPSLLERRMLEVLTPRTGPPSLPPSEGKKSP